jgi:glutamate racemase
MTPDNPIGIFDSGVGGLTVLREIVRRLPCEDIVYFGDTARVPYGSKSSPTVIRFAEEDCRFLMHHRPKLIVVACNTASSYAIDTLRRRIATPLVGVIEPGARAAVAATRSGRVGVIATQATVNSQAYVRAVERLDPSVEVIQRASPLLVPIVEEGRDGDDPVVAMVLDQYLAPLREAGVDVLVLGCTHYPLLTDAIARTMGDGVRLVDSATETARTVTRVLGDGKGVRAPGGAAGRLTFMCSDNPELFGAIGSRFLDAPIAEVRHASPEEFFGTAAVSAAAEGR